MQVILQGSARHFPPAELLSFVLARGLAATVDFETTGRKTRVFVEKDKIVWAESSRGAEVTDAIVDALEWTAGTFTVLDSAVLPENVKALAIELPPLLEEVQRRAAAAAVYRNSTSFRVVDDPAMQQQVSLSVDDLKLLFRLTGGRSFEQLIGDTGLSRPELTERLKRLEQLRLLRREDPQEVKTDAGLPIKRALVGSLTPDNAPDTVYPLLDAECTIGRADDNSVAIADGSISSRHARIVRMPDGFAIDDLQSRNGTFVNGEKISERRMLHDGDLIRLGKVIVTFNVAKQTRAPETTQPEVPRSAR